MPTRLLLADDHVLVRQGFKTLLEREGFQVVGEASDGHEAIRLAAKDRPDVAVLDITMPLLNGLDACREIRKGSPKTKVILVTQHNEDHYVTEALRAGAKGYVLKSQAANELVQAIHQVCRDGIYLSACISRALVEAFTSKTELPAEHLTERERQVVQLIGEGKSNRDVGKLLGISVKTAESHRAKLMQKLDIHETASLVRYAIRRGLVQP